jgi:hypothetical protein
MTNLMAIVQHDGPASGVSRRRAFGERGGRGV